MIFVVTGNDLRALRESLTRDDVDTVRFEANATGLAIQIDNGAWNRLGEPLHSLYINGAKLGPRILDEINNRFIIIADRGENEGPERFVVAYMHTMSDSEWYEAEYAAEYRDAVDKAYRRYCDDADAAKAETETGLRQPHTPTTHHTRTDSTVDTDTDGYAWIIDHTMTTDENDDTQLVEDTENSSNGTTGPYDAPPELLARLANGEGRVWRTLYDVDYTGHPADQRICHTGRYLDWADLDNHEQADHVAAYAEFGPLDDFSRPDSGAVEIQYQDRDGTWKTL